TALKQHRCRKRRVHQDDRIEVGVLAGRTADRCRLVHARYRDDVDARHHGQTVHSSLEHPKPIAEVAAERKHRALRRSAHARLRSIVTATSSKGTLIGASGLCTVTWTFSTLGSARHASAIRWASVSMRSTGSPSTMPTTVLATMP